MSLLKMSLLGLSILLCPPVQSSVLVTAAGNALHSEVAAQNNDSVHSLRWPFDEKEAKRRQAAAAMRLGQPVEKGFTLAPGVSLVCVLVPGGSFVQGRKTFPPSATHEQQNRDFTRAEVPAHKVTISRPFYLGKYEITQAQWVATGARLPPHPGLDETRGDLPAEYVFWDEVQKFLPLLQKILPDGWRCRVPTEAEWEYACRAGSDTAFYFGQATTPAQVSGAIPTAVVPVGSFAPNAWGLHDMHGSVWEYCADYYDPEYYGRSPAVDPLCRIKPAALQDVEGHVLRGGSHGYDDFYARSAHRGWAGEKLGTFERVHERGLRIVLEPPLSANSK